MILTQQPKSQFMDFMRLAHGISDVKSIAPDEAIAKLNRIWRESLIIGRPAYEIYDMDEYLHEAWLCWKVYSRKYLLSLNKFDTVEGMSVIDHIIKTCGYPENIMDLGCGLGYTTAAIKEYFRKSNVYGTNVKDSKQWKFAETLAKAHDFEMIASLHDIESCDLIFASEYFEHFDWPIDHLKFILSKLNPKVMLIANTFTSMAPGHFHFYSVDCNSLSGRRTSLEFNKEVRNSGYEKVKTRLWNNRPIYWRKR